MHAVTLGFCVVANMFSLTTRYVPPAFLFWKRGNCGRLACIHTNALSFSWMHHFWRVRRTPTSIAKVYSDCMPHEALLHVYWIVNARLVASTCAAFLVYLDIH
jgi:hypothetical protein